MLQTRKVLVTRSDTFSASDEMVDASVVDLFFDIQYLVGRIYRTYYLMKPVCMRQRRQHWADGSPVIPTCRHAAARCKLEEFATSRVAAKFLSTREHHNSDWTGLSRTGKYCLPKKTYALYWLMLQCISQNSWHRLPFNTGEKKISSRRE